MLRNKQPFYQLPMPTGDGMAATERLLRVSPQRQLAAVREPVWQLRSRTSGLRNPEKVLFERLRDVGAMSA